MNTYRNTDFIDVPDERFFALLEAIKAIANAAALLPQIETTQADSSGDKI